MGHRSITSMTLYETSELNQNVETYAAKAVTMRGDAEKLIALLCEFHYHAPDDVVVFCKKGD